MTKPWEETWVPGPLNDEVSLRAAAPSRVILTAISGEVERDHNRAHLAAAAPDLYRALDAIITGQYATFSEVTVQAEAALRKARGETLPQKK